MSNDNIDEQDNSVKEQKESIKENIEDNTEENSENNEDNAAENTDEDVDENIGNAVETTDLQEDNIIEELEAKDSGDKKRKPRYRKVLLLCAIPVVLILLTVGFLMKTHYGNKLLIQIVGNYSYDKFNKEEVVNIPENEKPIVVQEEEDEVIPEEKYVYNILLIGVENFEGASNTDTMMVASLDTKNKELKLTSLMRDLYVTIPEHQNNKLNAPYAMGGIQLLYDTIELNFGLKMDGYVLVKYDAFEKIIDYMGGVTVTLTKNEAGYLNKKNYISNPANRHVVEGTQVMNGNQALGYCRIRYVSTGKESDDFGRTSRQRNVLQSLFNKMKSKNIIDLGLTLNHILNNINITTDITRTDYNNYLQLAVDINPHELKTYRVPANGNYIGEKHQIGKYNQEVLVPTSWEETRKELNEFIYGAAADLQ